MKIKEKVDLNNYKYKKMFERFIKERNQSVCVTGCFDVTTLYNYKSEHSFNAMLCYCILQAAQKIDEYHYSIDENNDLYHYENVKVNAVVNGIDGNLYYADYKYFDNFIDFEKEYIRVNDYCKNNCVHYKVDTGALIGTSAMINYPFTSFSIGCSDIFWDNFMLWGSYIKNENNVQLYMTLRFHHATIDGQHAGLFFSELQRQMNEFKL